MNKKHYIILFVSLLYSFLPAINNKIIEKISIYGNKKVKNKTIIGIISLKEGKVFIEKNIENSHKKLKHLNIFSRIAIELKQKKKTVVIIISVKEKKLFYIDPFLSLNDNDSNQYNIESELNLYGMRVGLHDFSGKRYSLSLSAGIGKLKKLQLRLYKEYFSGFFWGIDVSNIWYNSTVFKSKVEIQTNRISFGGQYSDWLIRIWSNYTIMRRKILELDSTPDKIIKLGADIEFNNKDWGYFPMRGFCAGLKGYVAFNEKGVRRYDRFTIDFSGFFRLINQNVLAVGIRGVLSKGNIPLRDKIYFGGYKTVRGLSIEKYSGNSSIIASAEFRIPFSKINKNSIFGLAIYLFTDVGILADEVKYLNLNQIKYSTGLGLASFSTKGFMFHVDMTLAPKFRITLTTDWKF